MQSFKYASTFFAMTLAMVLAGPAWAQVKPIPNPKPTAIPAPAPVAKPAQPQVPKDPRPPRVVTVNPRPLITITPNPARDHQTVSLTVAIGGLGDAQAVHLFGFEPGCDFGQTPVSNAPMRRDLTDSTRSRSGAGVSYTTDVSAGRTGNIQLPGIKVTDGLARITITGRIGGAMRFSPSEERSGQSDEGLLDLARYTTNSTSDGRPRTCQPRAVLMVQGRDGVWRNLRRNGSLALVQESGAEAIDGMPWRTIGGRRVTHTNSVNSRNILNPTFRVVRPGSSCSGVSRSPGSVHPVGMLEDNHDLVFRIRSGPIGTHCRLSIPTRGLGDGMRVTYRFKVSTVGNKCRIGAPAAGIGVPGGFILERADRALLGTRRLESAGVHMMSWSGWINPNGHISGDRLSHRTVLQAAEMDLFCDVTAVNDHAIEVRLEEVEYFLPDGVPMPV